MVPEPAGTSRHPDRPVRFQGHCPIQSHAIELGATLVPMPSATAEDIDEGMKLGCNQPIGPLALADMIGLDVCLAVLEVYLAEFGDPKYRPCPLLREMVAAGRLGRKTKSGVYAY